MFINFSRAFTKTSIVFFPLVPVIIVIVYLLFLACLNANCYCHGNQKDSNSKLMKDADGAIYTAENLLLEQWLIKYWKNYSNIHNIQHSNSCHYCCYEGLQVMPFPEITEKMLLYSIVRTTVT